MSPIHERVKWVDTLRFLGILAIYVGHFGPAPGKAYPFVFCYNVQLFFFASGFFAVRTRQPILTYIREKLQQLMVPYLTFSILALTYYSALGNWDAPQITEIGKTFLFGIRNRVFAARCGFFHAYF
jgi:fucose 4-O-acetylase-like acetyltransferase